MKALDLRNKLIKQGKDIKTVLRRRNGNNQKEK